jgi:hypothetical protein
MTNYDGGDWNLDPHSGGVRRCGHCGTVGARLLCAAEVEQVLAVAADRIAAMGQTPPGYNLSTLLADALRGAECDAERRKGHGEGDGTGEDELDRLRAVVRNEARYLEGAARVGHRLSLKEANTVASILRKAAAS